MSTSEEHRPYISTLFDQAIGRDEYHRIKKDLSNSSIPSYAQELAACLGGFIYYLLPTTMRMRETVDIATHPNPALEYTKRFIYDKLGVNAAYIIAGAGIITANQMGYLPDSLAQTHGHLIIHSSALTAKVGINMLVHDWMNRKSVAMS